MKLYDGRGTNPHMVRMFIAEKGIEIPCELVDIMAGHNRQPDYMARVNPAGQIPALELDDGTVITETTAICEYLEERFPTPALIGTTPQERAETRMWTRRVDLNICEPMSSGFRYGEGYDFFKDRVRCLPEASDGLKAVARDRIAWLDGLMEGREFIAGARLTMADILLYSALRFFTKVGQPLDPELNHIPAWFERMNARPSANA